MAAILINQDIYPELRKLGIQETVLDDFNHDFINRVHTIPSPSLVGMALDHADDVVRWAIDATLGLPNMPELIASRFRPPVLVERLPLHPIDPISLDNAVSLGPLFSSPAARGLLAATAISSRITGGQTPPAVRLMNAATGGSEPLSTANMLQSPGKSQVLGRNIELGPFREPARPDWETFPELYIFPTGFPRTKKDMALVVQTAGLIRVFKGKTDSISQRMTDEIRGRAPSWRLPSGTNINWSDEGARFGFLSECDQILSKADEESHELFANTLISMTKEAGSFLAATREYVFCHPKIFEDYWAGQLRSVVYDGYRQMDEYLARQRSTVDGLKTQLSHLDFDQDQAAAAAAQAQRQQDSTCEDIVDVVRWVGIGVVFVGAGILSLLTLGHAHDPYPNSGSYGPVNPNDPNIPDPSRPSTRE